MNTLIDKIEKINVKDKKVFTVVKNGKELKVCSTIEEARKVKEDELNKDPKADIMIVAEDDMKDSKPATLIDAIERINFKDWAGDKPIKFNYKGFDVEASEGHDGPDGMYLVVIKWKGETVNSLPHIINGLADEVKERIKVWIDNFLRR
jgi:hypothetical protein